MAQGKLHDQDYQIQFKSGLATDVNADATKNLAVEGEPHWATDTDRLYVFDGTQNKGVMMESAAGVPATASDPGEPGDMAYDGSYVYVCVATDTWLRAALSSW